MRPLASFFTFIAVGSAAAQAPPPPREGLDCMIQPHQVVQVGSASAGVIERILVDRGDSVKSGQPIVQLDASVERAALAVARERANQAGGVKAAAGSKQLAQRELERSKELFEQNFVSRNYLDKQHAEVQVAGGRSDEAIERRRLAARELALAVAQLEQRTIRAPLDGVVVERFMSSGEFVEQKPVLRIAAIDPLRVDVLVPAAAFGQVSVGMKGSVLPELFNTSRHVATVKTVDRVIDAASNTFRVRLELPNPNRALPAGLRCKVDLGLDLAGQIGRGATQATSLPLAGAALVPAPKR
jgi:membrane fusion protein, heavy metal efflux system